MIIYKKINIIEKLADINFSFNFNSTEELIFITFIMQIFKRNYCVGTSMILFAFYILFRTSPWFELFLL